MKMQLLAGGVTLLAALVSFIACSEDPVGSGSTQDILAKLSFTTGDGTKVTINEVDLNDDGIADGFDFTGDGNMNAKIIETPDATTYGIDMDGDDEVDFYMIKAGTSVSINSTSTGDGEEVDLILASDNVPIGLDNDGDGTADEYIKEVEIIVSTATIADETVDLFDEITDISSIIRSIAYDVLDDQNKDSGTVTLTASEIADGLVDYIDYYDSNFTAESGSVTVEITYTETDTEESYEESYSDKITYTDFSYNNGTILNGSFSESEAYKETDTMESEEESYGINITVSGNHTDSFSGTITYAYEEEISPPSMEVTSAAGGSLTVACNYDDTDFEGTYDEEGTHNDQPYFKHASKDYYIFIDQYGEAWTLDNELGDSDYTYLAHAWSDLYFKFSQSEILKTFESARLTTFLIPSYVH